MGACCFCACIFKMILGILNMVLLLLGALTAASGGILLSMSDSPLVLDIVRNIVAPVLERLYGKDIISGSITGNFREILGPVSWALIVIGCILIAISIFGYIGLSLGINLCLAIYACLVGTIILVEILLMILFFSGALNKPMDSMLVKTIQENYGDVNDTNVIALSWNLVMLKFNCCGATGFKDFQENLQKTSNWPKRVKVTVSGQDFDRMFDMPVFCCKTTGIFPQLSIDDMTCVEERSENNFKDKGCREAIWIEIGGLRSQMLTFGVFGIFIQIIILVMICVVMQENKVFPNRN